MFIFNKALVYYIAEKYLMKNNLCKLYTFLRIFKTKFTSFLYQVIIENTFTLNTEQHKYNFRTFT